ncbi:MAG: hypothetical protein O4805_11840, partial [Trichodesmium sp. St16_bin2-tuft]|nr:hypothetical protein [Trichodesmium sp. St16_bin2-tuft]
MLNQGNNQLNHADIEEEIDIKSDKLINDRESIGDWFNSLEIPDVENTNYNLTLERIRKDPEVGVSELKSLEVGVSELKSLADLFECETPDLDYTWEEEEILKQGKLEVDDLKISVVDIDDSGDLSDLLFDVDEVEKLPEIKDESEWDFVDPVDDDLSYLLKDTEENELYKYSQYQSKNANFLPKEKTDKTKSNDDL